MGWSSTFPWFLWKAFSSISFIFRGSSRYVLNQHWPLIYIHIQFLLNTSAYGNLPQEHPDTHLSTCAHIRAHTDTDTDTHTHKCMYACHPSIHPSIHLCRHRQTERHIRYIHSSCNSNIDGCHICFALFYSHQCLLSPHPFISIYTTYMFIN